MTLTLQAVQDKLGVWVTQVQGKYINEDWNPTNEGFGAQCWDLAANWSKYLGLPVINTGYPGKWVGWAGNMVDAYPQTPAIGAAYELIPPDQPGFPGDIAVWGDSYKEYYPATHVAVLIRDANLQLLCASQNSTSSRMDNPYPKWSSGPATIQYLPRRGLLGFLRPRAGGSINYQSTTPASEEDDVTTPEQIDRIVTAGAEATQAAIDHLYKRISEDIVGRLDELNGAHHVATREHVNGTTKRILDREPLVIDRLDVLNTAHHVATREHVNGVRDGLLANFRATIDLLKPSADAGAVEAAEKIYAEVAERLSNLKITVTTGEN
ncbi:hypothetical protein [Arthrobacter sp. SD76]|uniref:hypothetical protein n=1 Tax=Arthrobacter sp. SD76 TaxID=3415007 RepID=UPI003C734F12